MNAHRLPLRCAALFVLSLPASAATIYAVAGIPQSLVSFDSATPSVYQSATTITGLQPGEQVLSLDFRPLNAELFALGSMSRLYRLDRVTGVATAIGSAGTFTLSGAVFGLDFNPTVDRLRLVSDADQNLRLNPDNAAIQPDAALNYAVGDLREGQNPTVVAAAYVNDFAGAFTTVLYAIDSGFNSLVLFPSNPNTGVLATVGPLGFDIVSAASFDILSAGTTDQAFAALNTGGASWSLYSINLSSGAATPIGSIGPVPTPIDAIAVAPIRIFRNGYE